MGGSGSRTTPLTVFAGHLYYHVENRKWVPNKKEVYPMGSILYSPDSFIWSVFILQPTGMEHAVAGGSEQNTLQLQK